MSFPQMGEVYVRTVVWLPLGGEDGDTDRSPFVYVVVGPPRP